MAQIVADSLGVGIDDIVVLHGDTAITQTGIGTFGSRSAAVGGGAMVMAVEQVREKVVRIAAHLLEAAPEDIERVDRGFSVRGLADESVTLGFGLPGVADRAVPLGEIAAAAYAGNVPEGDEPGLEASRFFKPSDSVFPFGVHIAVVDVDKETG